MSGESEFKGLESLFAGGESFMVNNNSIWPLLIAALLVLILIVVVWFRAWRERVRNRVAVTDEEVFQALSRANGLSRHQVFVLRDMYHDLRLHNPVTLFVCPQLYDGYLEHIEGARAEVIRLVRERVFEAPSQDQPES
jgi:hypothetical protein